MAMEDADNRAYWNSWKDADDNVDFRILQHQCGTIAHALLEDVSILLGMQEEGRASWMHGVGVALELLRMSLMVKEVPDANVEWLHQKIILAHELVHAYQAGGSEAVISMLRAASGVSNDEKPDNCSLH